MATSARRSGPLSGRTIFITGASRGIGKAIALRAAADGANLVITGKTSAPHEKLAGTIHSAAAEVEAAGGQALAVAMDVRDESQVQAAVAAAVERFGGIDCLVNNASAIHLSGTLATPIKRFDLMQAVNVRGTFVATQACLPHLQASAAAASPGQGGRGHVLMLSPPLTIAPRHFAPHLAYSLSKYGMSLCVLGLAEELRPTGVAVNALWPATLIATAAVEHLLGGEASLAGSRTPAIVAEAAYRILSRPARTTTGTFFTDEQVLAEEGIQDLERYRASPGSTSPLLPDLFL